MGNLAVELSARHPLTQDIVRVFDVTPEFIQAYMARQAFSGLDDCSSWKDFSDSLNPTQLMYVDFAMSCVWRAKSVVELITSRLGPDNTKRRCLDVGCGYGGFVREFARRGYEAVGVELQEHLAAFSAANCVGMNGARIIHSDFLAVDPAELGMFDVITCNDVIEHVQDPEEVMRRMSAMLRPGGILFMEIPNKDCIESVTKDGHFQVFGITQLERNAASQYLSIAAGRDDYLEQMGEMYELGFYRDTLEKAGNSVETVQRHVIGDVSAVPQLVSNLTSEFAQWVGFANERLGPHLRRHILQKIAAYQEGLWSDFEAVQRGDSREAFELRYLNSFWSVLATRR